MMHWNELIDKIPDEVIILIVWVGLLCTVFGVAGFIAELIERK